VKMDFNRGTSLRLFYGLCTAAYPDSISDGHFPSQFPLLHDEHWQKLVQHGYDGAKALALRLSSRREKFDAQIDIARYAIRTANQVLYWSGKGDSKQFYQGSENSGCVPSIDASVELARKVIEEHPAAKLGVKLQDVADGQIRFFRELIVPCQNVAIWLSFFSRAGIKDFVRPELKRDFPRSLEPYCRYWVNSMLP